ncbi:hypothetical protein [Massilia sp. 9096]|uniref:hypothetical protein n=1 Tax=Massilia sp. 9096 TaxID=1500894 RepID=UPI0012E0B0DC|nr:hypothetical protein [Massilia sp. 9096]
MDEWIDRVGKVYRPGESPGPGEAPPSGLALGDAWFWHGDQTLLHELVNHPHIAPGHAAIRLLGFNGGRLNEYIGDGVFAGVIRMHLVPGIRFSEFYLGGFANEAFEHNLALLDDCMHAHTPADCFSAERLDLLLYHIFEGLSGIIRTIRWTYRKTTWQQPVFLNGYDYPVPDGRGFVSTHGGPVTGVMDEAHVDPDPDFRREIMRRLIDAINDEVLAGFHAPLERVFHIDSRGTLADSGPGYLDDWDNEIYPSAQGFRKILERAWLPRLRPFGIVTGK